MDNNHNFHNLFQHFMDANPHVGQQIGNAINTLVHGFMQHHPPPQDGAERHPEDDPELMDLPPLEPMERQPAPNAPQEREMAPVGVPSSHSRESESTAHAAVPSQPPVAGPSLPPVLTPPHLDIPVDMPPLEGDSESNSDVDMRDVEMSVDQSENAEPAPSSRNSRRTRVDDEDDEDNMRESNRQRIHSPHPNDEGHHGLPPQWHPFPGLNGAPFPPAPNGENGDDDVPPPPVYSRIIYTLDFLAPPPPHDAQHEGDAQGDAHEHDHHHDHHHHHPGMTFSFNFPPPTDGARAAGPNTGQGNGDPIPPGAGASVNAVPPNFQDNLFQQFIQQLIPEGAIFGDGATFTNGGAFPIPFPFPFMFSREEEQDDPERAKRLVAGLEEVPLGLVQRMERVGGPGTEEGDTPGCAICWEKLVDPEAGGFGLDPPPPFEESEHVPAPSDSNTPAGSRASSSTPSDGSEAAATLEERPRIVALPCSHVFHSSCLLPWFSKPHRTTCPSCRFDIDPESLTYVPRMRRPRQQGPAAPAGAQPAGPGSPAPAPAPANPTESNGNAMPGAPPPFVFGAAPPPAVTGENPPHGARPPLIAVDFSLFIPMGVAMPGAGAAGAAPGRGPAPQQPTFMQLGEQASRDMFTRLFGGGRSGAAFPQPPPFGPVPAPPAQQAQGQAPAQPQPHPQAAPAGAPQTGSAGEGQPGDRADPRRTFDMGAFFEHMRGGTPQATAGAQGTNAAPQPPRQQNRSRPPEKRQWTLPAPPGPTLRQRIERKEREAGLRCWDVSCGLGPSDEDPTPIGNARAVRQVPIHPAGAEEGAVCEHRFHPACLVSAERVAGWGGEDKKEEKEGETVEVSCPSCRAVGCISRVDWDEGACALA